MKREDVYKQYLIDESGVIHSPGKFEGEMLYAPYFYDLLMNGSGGDQVNGVYYFTVDADDLKEFPELFGVYGVALEQSEQGFVTLSAFTSQKEYDFDVQMQSEFGNTED